MVKYAGVIIRGGAFMLDFLFLSLFFFPITYIVKGTWLMTTEDHLWTLFDPICGVFLITIFLYFIFMEGLFGFTIGKVILGLRVREANNEKITIKQSFIRNVSRIIDGLPCFNIFGIVSILKSNKNQRVGDKLGNTVVIKVR